MTRYIMIESNSGYVWFDTADIGALDETPAEACKRMDEDLNAHEGHTYETHGDGYNPNGADAYFVYEAPEGFPLAHDPSTRAAVEAVENNCKLVAVVTSTPPPDLGLTWWQHYAPPADNEDPADWAEAKAEYLKDMR